MSGLRLAVLRLRHRIRPRGVHIYRAASNARIPIAALNRYPSGVIGVAFRLPRHRVLSVVWRRAR